MPTTVGGALVACQIPTSASQLNVKSEIELYPNPAHAIIHIQWNKAVGRDVSYEIHDLSGKSILAGRYLSAENPALDVSILPNGLYFLKLKSENLTANRKFVVGH